MRTNNLRVWSQRAYEDEVVVRSVFGRSSVIFNAPEAIRHVLVDHPETYGRSRATLSEGMAHKRMHNQATERWPRTRTLALCRISAPIAAQQVPSKLNNKEGLTMIAQATDNTPPEAFLEYEGVTVYRTYQFDDPSTYPPSSHIFTTSPNGSYASDPFRFDIRSLTVPAASADESGVRAGEEVAIAAVLEQAISRGMLAKPERGPGSRPVQVYQQAW